MPMGASPARSQGGWVSMNVYISSDVSCACGHLTLNFKHHSLQTRYKMHISPPPLPVYDSPLTLYGHAACKFPVICGFMLKSQTLWENFRTFMGCMPTLGGGGEANEWTECFNKAHRYLVLWTSCPSIFSRIQLLESAKKSESWSVAWLVTYLLGINMILHTVFPMLVDFWNGVRDHILCKLDMASVGSFKFTQLVKWKVMITTTACNLPRLNA